MRAPPVAGGASNKEWQRSALEAAVSAARQRRAPQQEAATGHMAEKKYTAKQFRAAVEAYFDSITRTTPLIVAEPDLVPGAAPGEFKPRKEIFGRAALKYVQPKTKNGQTAQTEEYIIQPTLSGLCLCLGISRQTWARYAKEKGYRDAVQQARLRIETYLQDLLMQKNSSAGAKFSLEHNFGWGGAAGPDGAQEAQEQAEELSLAEKLELLRGMGLTMPNEKGDKK